MASRCRRLDPSGDEKPGLLPKHRAMKPDGFVPPGQTSETIERFRKTSEKSWALVYTCGTSVFFEDTIIESMRRHASFTNDTQEVFVPMRGHASFTNGSQEVFVREKDILKSIDTNSAVMVFLPSSGPARVVAYEPQAPSKHFLEAREIRICCCATGVTCPRECSLEVDLAFDGKAKSDKLGEQNTHLPGMYGNIFLYARGVEHRCLTTSEKDLYAARTGIEVEEDVVMRIRRGGYVIPEDLMIEVAAKLQILCVLSSGLQRSVLETIGFIRETYSTKNGCPSAVADSLHRRLHELIKDFEHKEAEHCFYNDVTAGGRSEMIILMKSHAAFKKFMGELNGLLEERGDTDDRDFLARMGDAEKPVVNCMVEKSMPYCNISVMDAGKRIGRFWLLLQKRYVDNDVSQDRQRSKSDESSCDALKALEEAHEEHLRAERSALLARELQRKTRAVAEREWRANSGSDVAASWTGANHVSKKQKKRTSRMRKERERAQQSALQHEVHVMPGRTELATARFETKQALEHAERLAREERAVAEEAKKRASEISAAKEAAMHVVPAAPSIGEALGAALAAMHF